MAKLYFYYGAMGACKSATAITTAYKIVTHILFGEEDFYV